MIRASLVRKSVDALFDRQSFKDVGGFEPLMAELRNNEERYVAAGVAAEVAAALKEMDASFEVAVALKEMDASFEVEFGADYELTLIDRATGTRTPPALGSGYQQFVTALAARWALARVARVPLPACFMIDEGFGCLDEANLPRVAEALGALALRAPAAGTRPLVLAVTHREDMAPYFAERLEIDCPEAGHAGGSRVTYPAGAEADLGGVAMRVPAGRPARRCETCDAEVAATSWEAHTRSARHRLRAAPPRRCDPCGLEVPARQWDAHCARADHRARAAARGEVAPAAFYCEDCEREVAPSRWEKHGGTAAHAKAAAAMALRDQVVAAHPGEAGPAPGRKVACLACPDGPAFTVKQWARHAASAKHRGNVE